MEETGIRVDPAELSAAFRADGEPDRAAHVARFMRLAGREFNIASPQQLGRVLFEEMGLPAP